jgi:TfoX/Sxy family transcriptional regulator of competence genes
MSPTKKTPPTAKEVLYESLVATLPGVERKGDANPYTSLNGNMFSLLQAKTTLALRLPEKERAEFIAKHKTKLFEAYGVVMKEYVAVPEALLKTPTVLEKYFAISYDYAKTLKAKPTKRPAKAAKKSPRTAA